MRSEFTIAESNIIPQQKLTLMPLQKIPANSMAMRLDANFSLNKDATVKIKRNGPASTKYTLTVSFEFDADEITGNQDKDPGNNDYVAFTLDPDKIGETTSMHTSFIGAGDSAYFSLRSIQVASNGRKVRSGAAGFTFKNFIDSLDSIELEELKKAIMAKSS